MASSPRDSSPGEQSPSASATSAGKKSPSFFKRFFSALGPGVITGAADDDPSGIATYSIAGARYGTQLLWTSIVTWPLMAAVQMTCARIGMVTGRGLVGAMRKSFPRWSLIVMSLSLLVANTINIASDLSAMADAGRTLTGIPSLPLVLFFGIVIAWATIQLRYQQFAGVLKWLTLVLFAYVATALHVGPDWRQVLQDVITPTIPREKEAWRTVVAILGTTISPYLLFWQASEEVEEQKARGLRTVRSREGATPREITDRRLDVGFGTLFANTVFFFIVLTTALTLHKHGVVRLETSSQVAQALRPLAGRFAELLYTLGLIGVGLLAIPTLAGSAAYAFAETFGWRQGLDQKLSGARSFYGVIILSTAGGIALDFLKINPVHALYWTAVINGLLAPFLLVALLRCAADPKLMRGQDSPLATRIVVGITAALMFAAGIGMFVF